MPELEKHTVFCEQCGDCMDCYWEDPCLFSPDGKHQFIIEKVEFIENEDET